MATFVSGYYCGVRIVLVKALLQAVARMSVFFCFVVRVIFFDDE